jgi:ankyrin repeat protein
MIVPVKELNSGTNEDGELPDIIQAAYDGNIAKVAALLAGGVSVNSVDPRDNLTILHIACLQGDTRLAETLLQHDTSNDDLDYGVVTKSKSRQAWQLAMAGNFFDLAHRVHRAALVKTTRKPPSP